MRRVACFAASSALNASEEVRLEIEKLTRTVESWLRAKGCRRLPTDRDTFPMGDGRVAEVTYSHFESTSGYSSEIGLDEPTEAGRFFTRICLAAQDGRLHFFAELRAGASEYQIAPLSVDVRTPQVVRGILASRTWTLGTTPVLVRPIEWFGRDSAKKFIATLHHEQRNLPLVVASQSDGAYLTPSFVQDLSRDLAGVSLVVGLDESASWEVSRQLGRQWSCYRGAVRIYWPILGAPRASDHPVWTQERLLASAPTVPAAASRIREQIRRRLLALSTFAVDDPPQLRRIREDAAKEAFEKLRREAEERGDQTALAEQYFNEAARLEAIVSETKVENERLRAQVESLSAAWRYSPETEGGEIAPEALPAPTTVEEAVNLARERFADELVFGDEVADGIAGLSSEAGPPEKVFQYLEVLAEMTRVRRSDGLGRDLIAWLRAQGVKASGESETILRSTSEMRRRTWHDGVSPRAFDKHLKPTDGTSPDRCVRIYFEYDDVRGKTAVGYVGRHV